MANEAHVSQRIIDEIEATTQDYDDEDPSAPARFASFEDYCRSIGVTDPVDQKVRYQQMLTDHD